MNVNQIVRIIPTLKVNNRKLNETFYIETLGMKALLEESAFLSLGDQTGLEKLVLEEAHRSDKRSLCSRKSYRCECSFKKNCGIDRICRKRKNSKRTS